MIRCKNISRDFLFLNIEGFTEWFAWLEFIAILEYRKIARRHFLCCSFNEIRKSRNIHRQISVQLLHHSWYHRIQINYFEFKNYYSFKLLIWLKWINIRIDLLIYNRFVLEFFNLSNDRSNVVKLKIVDIAYEPKRYANNIFTYLVADDSCNYLRI